jgi:phenylacetic acid degradation operon negative regulatory protein
VAAIRQTLFRMERDQELLTRRSGRMKFYSPSPYAVAEIQAGTEKIFEPPRRDWDSQWTIVRVGLRNAAMAKHRERVIALLAVEGFAQMEANLFVHPRQAAERLYDALPARARADVVIVRGTLAGDEARVALVALWRVDLLAQRFRRTMATLMQLETQMRRGISDRDAFLMRFAVVFEYLGVAWDDPDLPAQLLPADWPGDRARRLAARLYKRLLPGATRHAEAVLGSVLSTLPSHSGAQR